jgi:hypothetical protein
MRVERDEREVRVVLTPGELPLLKRALERASFIDTPANEQEQILAFCAQALDELARADRAEKHKPRS